MAGAEKTFSEDLRKFAGGAPGTVVQLGQGQRTPNRLALQAVRNYAVDPHGPSRAALFEYLAKQKLQHQGNEPLTSSHCAWYYNAWGGLLYFAHRNHDEQALQGGIELLARNLRLEGLLATPALEIVAPGARCFLGSGMSDQRDIRNRTHQLLAGSARYKEPHNLEALDWTGVWFLRQVPGDVLARVRAAAPTAALPGLISELHIERTSAGHLAWFKPPVRMLRPAYWARYQNGEERYGCVETWPKGFKSEEYPADMPELPQKPGGNELASVVLRAAA